MSIYPFIPGSFPMPTGNNQAYTPQATDTSAPATPPIPPVPPSTPTPEERPPVISNSRGIDLTLRVECRPCIYKLRRQNGRLDEMLKYVLVLTNANKGPSILGVVDEFVNNLSVDLTYSNEFCPIGEAVEEETEPETETEPTQAPTQEGV